MGGYDCNSRTSNYREFNLLNRVIMLNLQTFQVKKMSSFKLARAEFGFCALNNYIYITGGLA